MSFEYGKLKLSKQVVPYFKAAIIIIYAVIFCLASFAPVTVFLNGAVDDYFLQHGEGKSGKVCIVGITDEDVSEFGYSAPVIASMVVEKLDRSEKKPAVIGYDIPLSSWTDKSISILENVARNNSNLVIPVELSIDADKFLDMNRTRSGMVTANSAILPPFNLYKFCDLSHNVIVEDSDGIIRQGVFSISHNKITYPSMAWVCYEKYCIKEGIQPEYPDLSDQNAALIKFVGNKVLNCDYTAADIFNNDYDVSDTENIVYIGYFDTGLDIGYMTSVDYSTRMHSTEILANMTEGLISDNLALRLPAFFEILLLAAMVVLWAYVATRVSALGGICLCVVYLILTQIVGLLLYGVGYVGTMLPHMVNAPLTGVIFGFVAYSLRAKQNREELEHILGQYVDINIAKDIIREEVEADSLIGQTISRVKNKKIAVLFADIRNFTSISEKLPAHDLVNILNEYLSMMSICVNKYGGTLDKFIGDCAMGYWGAPGEDSDPVYHACLAANEMQRRSAELSMKIKRNYGIEIAIGIGINYGDAVVGNIGSEDRLNYTAVGDTVNTAARLEAFAPGGEIYLSEDAYKALAGRGEIEKLDEELILKGKNKPVSAYSLKSLSVEGSKSKAESEDRSLGSYYRRRGYFAAVINFTVAIIQFMFLIYSIRQYGTAHMMYFPIVLAAFSTVILILLIPYDIKTIDLGLKKSIRPRLLNSLFASAFAANIEIAALFIVNVVFDYGLSAYTMKLWPGGITIYLICPILVLLSITVFETWAEYKSMDILVSIVPLIVLRLISGWIMYNNNFIHLDENLFDSFYRMPNSLLSVLLEFVLLAGLSANNTRIQKRKDAKIMKYGSLDSVVSGVRNSRAASFLLSEINRHIVTVFVDVTILFFFVRTVRTAFIAGGIEIYSNPSLIGIIEIICCLVSIALNVMCIIMKKKFVMPSWYKYLVFIRQLGCIVNFASAMMLVFSGEGIMALFLPKWNADGWVFVFCPLISTITYLAERYEYKFTSGVLMAVPFGLLLLLSKAAIVSGGLYEKYQYEFSNFYSTSKLIIIIASEFFLSILMYYTNVFYARIIALADRSESKAFFTACGSRKNVVSSSKVCSDFGNHNSCYIFRDGRYAVVFDCGSGFANARKKLDGCTHVDVVISSGDSEATEGFAAVPSLCPDTKLRIITTPMIMNVLSHTPQFKEVYKKYCYTTATGKVFRLNNSYSLVLSSSESMGNNVCAKVYGVKNFVYMRTDSKAPKDAHKWFANLDMLVYAQDDDWKCACYLAIDNNIPKVIISGHSVDVSDESLNTGSVMAKKIISDISFAKEDVDYLV